jgi:hypothetical protein
MKIDTAMCGDFATAYIGVNTYCVYGNVINILFIERNICYLSHAVYVSQYIHNYSSMNIKLILKCILLILSAYYCHRHPRFHIPTVIYLLLSRGIPTGMQPSVFHLFPCTDATPLAVRKAVVSYRKSIEK